MKLKDISQEELDLMSYDELAALILEESRKKMKIFDLFKKVCNILNLSDAEFENKIADFFEILSTNKKFIMLENGYWDLKAKHNVEMIIDEEDDDTLTEVMEEDMDIEPEEEETDIFYETDDTDDEEDDDLQDLVVIDVDEDEANSL